LLHTNYRKISYLNIWTLFCSSSILCLTKMHYAGLSRYFLCSYASSGWCFGMLWWDACTWDSYGCWFL